jgi:dolichol-phosphate mannosyltransferase
MALPPPEFSIVLPAHNEAAEIEPMVAALKGVLAPIGRVEIIYVDDGSSDSTLAALRAAALSDPVVRYVSFTRNFGHQAALRAGLRHARARAVVVMDADSDIRGSPQRWRAARVATTRRDSDPA